MAYNNRMLKQRLKKQYSITGKMMVSLASEKIIVGEVMRVLHPEGSCLSALQL